jgi:hypothetical protein
MKRTTLIRVVVAVGLLAAIPLLAQEVHIASTGGHSPHETFSKVIDGNRVTIVYGRPFTKDYKTGEMRKIWGTLVPYGHWWRTGSDEATLMITQKAIKFGDLVVPPGAYTLYSLPMEDGTCKLIINKQLGQWGLEYHDDQDLGRVDMTKSDLPDSVDEFTMAIDKGATDGGVLELKWEKTEFSVPFTLNK